jgi:hypothetical protein
MQIRSELAAFLTSPVMIILGTCDAHGGPDIGRGVGARVDGDAGVVEVIVSGWQWPETVANVRATGRAAITFARPSDYASYQVKGPASIGEPDADALALSARYIDDITTILGALGLERRLMTHWLTDRDAVVLRMEMDAIFVQTPGSKAGQLIASGP